MEYKIKHVLPEDIFVSCNVKNKNDGSQDGGRLPSGNQTLDTIAALIHHYGHLSCREMARALGTDAVIVSHGVHLMTGLFYNDWRDRYLKLMLEYIHLHEPKCRLEALDRRLGFTCRSSRIRFEERMKKGK